MKKLRILFLVAVCMICWVGSVFSESPPKNNTVWKQNTFVRISSQFTSATLNISEVTSTQFNFKLRAFSGANTGGISGTAQIIGNNAVYNDKRGGFLKFTFINDSINIEEEKMGFYQGMGVVFTGNYIPEKKQHTQVTNENYFTECKVFKENQEQEFRRIVGDNYLKFKNTAQYFSKKEDLDGLGARIYQMNVRGLFTIMESIILIRDSDNAIWAAVIDNNKILYFTNTDNTKYVPLTISRWHDRFKDKPIYYIPIKQG